MRNPMCLVPDAIQFRFAVYACSYKIGLGDRPEQPMAIFQLRSHANEMGARMWPSTFEIVDLEECRP